MITVLWSSEEEVLTKQVTKTADGWTVAPYSNGTFFDVYQVNVHSLPDLAELLMDIENQPYCCVIRGKLIEGKPTTRVQRNKYETSGGVAPYFEPQPCQWLMVDFDTLLAPEGLTTAEERLEFLVSQLPPEFHNVSFFYQWSSSAGLWGWDTPKAHLWFWLDQPWSDDALRGKALDEGWPVDRAPFQCVQPNYTAKPIFTNCEDPLEGERSGIIIKDELEVKLTPWVKKVMPRPVKPLKPVNPSEVFQKHLDAIGNPDMNEPLLRACACYAALHGPHFDQEALKAMLRERIWLSSRSQREKAYYASDRKLNEQINSGIRKFAK